MNFLKKLWKAIQNRKKIWEGIRHSLFPKAYVEEVALKRLIICADCPELDRVGTKCFVPGSQPCCGVCGCSMRLKARSLSSACDLGKWGAEMSVEEEDAFRQKTKIVNE